ncbi:hypothetical protein BKN14_04040 [Candidatus Gracilibacteria bacterium HOT-871]|nr:hypothetical protein BKN14_04040 [Candidatus Gracilibacteria bacterium HOT-871]
MVKETNHDILKNYKEKVNLTRIYFSVFIIFLKMRKNLGIAVILLAAGLVSQGLTVNAFSDNFREKAEQHLQEILPGNIFWE